MHVAVGRKLGIKHILGILVGTMIASFGMVAFLLPRDLAPGGVGGLALVTKAVLPLPDWVSIGIIMLVYNVFLLILSFMIIGPTFGIGTIIGTIAFSFFIDLFQRVHIPPEDVVKQLTSDPLLAAIYGGVLVGVGLGIVFKYGGSTGGTDIIGVLVKHFTGLPVGQGMLLADGTVVTLMGIVFKSWQVVLLAIISIYITALAVDILQEGLVKNRKFLIITEKPEEMKRAILDDLGRGVTVFKAEGGYTGEPKDVLMVVVSRKEVEELRELIASIDKKAFYVVEDVAMTIGEGFIPHDAM